MHPEQSRLLAEERIKDAERAIHRDDDRFEQAEPGVVVRPARAEDVAALRAATPLLVAEVDGELAAVVLRADQLRRAA
jgi:FAD/FMN-containing dehydrogenase